MHEEEFDRSSGVIVWLMVMVLIMVLVSPFILQKIFS